MQIVRFLNTFKITDALALPVVILPPGVAVFPPVFAITDTVFVTEPVFELVTITLVAAAAGNAIAKVAIARRLAIVFCILEFWLFLIISTLCYHLESNQSLSVFSRALYR